MDSRHTTSRYIVEDPFHYVQFKSHSKISVNSGLSFQYNRLQSTSLNSSSPYNNLIIPLGGHSFGMQKNAQPLPFCIGVVTLLLWSISIGLTTLSPFIHNTKMNDPLLEHMFCLIH